VGPNALSRSEADQAVNVVFEAIVEALLISLYGTSPIGSE
jgi:hypothetical protein